MKDKPKDRVTLEREKVRRTTHWDMDYLPLETVKELYAREQVETPETASPEPPPRTASNRRLGVVCILAGVALLILTVALARLLVDWP